MTPSEASFTEAPLPGSPCWLEIATGDLAATKRFYGSVFGWEFEIRTDAAGEDYTVALLDGDPVAGLRNHVGPILDWTLYLTTPDLDATARDVQRFGGRVIEDRHVVPGVGAKMLVDDPSGATVGMCQPDEDWRFTVGLPRSLVWAELVTRRATVADRFFGALFRYEQRQFGDGKRVDHMVWYVDGESVLARVRMAEGTAGDVPPRWIAHFGVDPDVGFDQALWDVRSHGARLRFKPYTSSIGKVAVLSDSRGTRFAIIDSSLATNDGYRSANDDPYDD
jgi:predicted enzyme related to lactoylglutathione lyase